MNKSLSILLGMSSVVFPIIVSAQGGLHEGTSLSILSIGSSIVNVLWVVFTVLAIICFVVAGVLFLTAFGDTEKLKTARGAFIWGVVGVVVAILAFSIVSLVRNAIRA